MNSLWIISSTSKNVMSIALILDFYKQRFIASDDGPFETELCLLVRGLYWKRNVSSHITTAMFLSHARLLDLRELRHDHVALLQQIGCIYHHIACRSVKLYWYKIRSVVVILTLPANTQLHQLSDNSTSPKMFGTNCIECNFMIFNH